MLMTLIPSLRMYKQDKYYLNKSLDILKSVVNDLNEQTVKYQTVR